MYTITKLIIIPASLAVLMACATPAFASCDGLSVSGLSEEQVITLKQNCIKMENDAKAAAAAAAAVPAPILDKDHLEEYADIGKKYGVALSEVAKSVGTTVNELAQTPVGMFMLAIVAWKALGRDMVGLFGGMLWFTIMIPLLGHYFNKLVLKDRKVKETFDPTTKALVSREVLPLDWNSGQAGAAWILGILFIAMCACGFFMIF
jgi:hypothetical protein